MLPKNVYFKMLVAITLLATSLFIINRFVGTGEEIKLKEQTKTINEFHKIKGLEFLEIKEEVVSLRDKTVILIIKGIQGKSIQECLSLLSKVQGKIGKNSSQVLSLDIEQSIGKKNSKDTILTKEYLMRFYSQKVNLHFIPLKDDTTIFIMRATLE